jgi:hypothetical protein
MIVGPFTVSSLVAVITSLEATRPGTPVGVEAGGAHMLATRATATGVRASACVDLYLKDRYVGYVVAERVERVV